MMVAHTNNNINQFQGRDGLSQNPRLTRKKDFKTLLLKQDSDTVGFQKIPTYRATTLFPFQNGHKLIPNAHYSHTRKWEQ